MLPFLGDPFANSKKNYEDEDVASIQLRGIEVVGRTVSGKLLWNEADGGKAVIQVFVQGPGGTKTAQAQTQASPVQGERVTWSDELNIEVPKGSTEVQVLFLRDGGGEQLGPASAVVSLKDLALSVTRGFELELVLQQGASHAGHLRAKAQVVMHAPDPEECKGNHAMKMMGGKSKCYNDDDDDGHEESIQEKVKLVQGDTAKKAKLLREMKTMKAASRCFPMLLELGMKAEKVSDKVEEEMSALSVVNSLLTIVTFSLLSAVPAALDEPQNLPQKRAYAIITATAMMANMASVVLATMLKKSMNCLVDAGGISRQYIIRFSSNLTEILFFAFSLGILLMLASILMFVYFRYSDVECYVMIAITGASTLAVLCVYIVPHRLMVAAITKQFDKKMARLMGEPYDDSRDAQCLWRRVWNDGMDGLWQSSSSKVQADNSPV